ncbi:uncharacterized protein SCHCODRAFT_01147634 [Schizophyllum commune H4-8]|nr:uncharacterized protein SCHCODRAFT_01147634 [Schizophyllum commune H4-8]KAI5894562.1 hypothetical protein SCHCODRAFT_01147634 [Schizophyllum commune H4-8]
MDEAFTQELENDFARLLLGGPDAVDAQAIVPRTAAPESSEPPARVRFPARSSVSAHLLSSTTISAAPVAPPPPPAHQKHVRQFPKTPFIAPAQRSTSPLRRASAASA